MQLAPKESAILGLASLVTEAPWTLVRDDFERARVAGLSDATTTHVVVQAAWFSYLNRMADGLGIELDYRSDLPAMKRLDREPLPRPERSAWPPAPIASHLSLSTRATTAAMFARFTEYMTARPAPLAVRDRDVIRRAAAIALCDATTAGELESAEPNGDRERALASFATLATCAPWRLDSAALEPLRALGFDDSALLDAVAVTSYQNTASRIRLAIGLS